MNATVTHGQSCFREFRVKAAQAQAQADGEGGAVGDEGEGREDACSSLGQGDEDRKTGRGKSVGKEEWEIGAWGGMKPA